VNPVMNHSEEPDSPEKLAGLLDHMRGIPWHDISLTGIKDDWTTALADALKEMFESSGTRTTKKKGRGKPRQYKINLIKKDKTGAHLANMPSIICHGWDD